MIKSSDGHTAIKGKMEDILTDFAMISKGLYNAMVDVNNVPHELAEHLLEEALNYGIVEAIKGDEEDGK